jgi:CubicO group peptidase (beta-lactamase class C family)
MALAHFVDQGTIDWSTTVASVLGASFATNNSYLTQTLNVGDLLAHRSGYGDHSGDSLWIVGDVATEQELVQRRLPYLVPTERVGLEFMYSNIGYEVASMVLEKLAGEPWYSFVERRFWLPLGMNSTVAGLPALTPALASRLSGGHKYTVSPDEQESIGTFSMLDPTTPKLVGGITNGFLGAGSVIASAADYARWMLYLIGSNSSAVGATAHTAHARSARTPTASLHASQ